MATIRWCPIFPKWDIYQPLYLTIEICSMRARLPGFGATAPLGGRPWRVSPLPRQPSSPRPGAGKKHQRLKLVVFWKYDWCWRKICGKNSKHLKTMIFLCRAQETTNHWGLLKKTVYVQWTGDPVFYHWCAGGLVGSCSNFSLFIQLWVVEPVKQLKTLERSTWIMDGREDLLETSNQIGCKERRCGKIKNSQLKTRNNQAPSHHCLEIISHASIPAPFTELCAPRPRTCPPPNLQLLFCLRLQASTGCRVRSASSAEMAKKYKQNALLYPKGSIVGWHVPSPISISILALVPLVHVL